MPTRPATPAGSIAKAGAPAGWLLSLSADRAMGRPALEHVSGSVSILHFIPAPVTYPYIYATLQIKPDPTSDPYKTLNLTLTSLDYVS